MKLLYSCRLAVLPLTYPPRSDTLYSCPCCWVHRHISQRPLLQHFLWVDYNVRWSRICRSQGAPLRCQLPTGSTQRWLQEPIPPVPTTRWRCRCESSPRRCSSTRQTFPWQPRRFSARQWHGCVHLSTLGGWRKTRHRNILFSTNISKHVYGNLVCQDAVVSMCV